MQFHPRPYQTRFIKRLEKHKAVAGFIDMGLGKTACVLSAIVAMRSRALVVAPKRVCESTWPEEAAHWDHTRALRLRLIPHEIDGMWAALQTPADIHLVSYDNVRRLWWVMRDMPRWPWDLLVFDESSKMKAPTSKRMRSAKQSIGRFSRRVLLSGTPSPEGYGDLWSQMYLLDQGKRLGSYISHFRSNYMEPADWHGYTWRLQKGAAATVERKIKDLVVCLRSEDYLTLPPVVRNTVTVDLPARARKAYNELERKLFTQLNKADIEAVNAAALSGKCCQLASGQVYNTEREPIIGHRAKLDAVATIVEDAQGSPAIICYQYQHELARLLNRFPQAVRVSAEVLARWNRGTVPLLLAHPASCGHGLNLQRGGHILIWYTLPWAWDQYEQMVKRLHRSGQRHPVVMHRILARDTVDDAKVDTLAAKGESQAGLVAALARYARRKTRPVR